MRLYGGRLLKSRVSQQITNRQEIRDAIVMSVDSTNKYALVKIQGSNTSIKAWYPENWESTPNYLKPGNSVRINQPGGNKARIEIMGMGVLLPTAVPGGSVTPTPIGLTDAVLSGCNLYPANPASMAIMINSGTYRLDDVTYSLSGLLMDDATVEMDRLDLTMDDVGGTVTLDAASATQFRYDTICAGVDGVIHIVKGSNFSVGGTIPDPPDATADHIDLGFVLIPPNCTTIIEAYINQLYVAPVATYMVVTVDENPMLWATTDTYIRLSIRDQYGNYYVNATPPGWQFSIAWATSSGVICGDGTLEYNGETATSATSPFAVNYTGSTAAAVKFTKDLSSTMFNITENLTGYNTVLDLEILDALGVPLISWPAA